MEQTEVEIKAHCDDNATNPDGHIERLAKYSDEMGAAYGTDFRIADRMKEEMEDAGFVDVREVRFKLPLGPWSADARYKEIGKFYERYYKTGLQGWLMRILTSTLGVRSALSTKLWRNLTNSTSGRLKTSTSKFSIPSERSILTKTTTTFTCELLRPDGRTGQQC